MDLYSHRLANALVGNPRGCAALEVTLLGPELTFEAERVVAVAGAEFELTVDGRPAPMNAAFVVAAESRLRFGARRKGSRAYLATAGGIDVPLVLGSRATHVISAMGGLDGRALRAGDRLPLGDGGRSRGAARTPVDLPQLPEGRARLRVIAGPQDDHFTGEALDALQSAPYTIGANSDRMGFRLTGPPLPHARGADIISDATPAGALQVPASAQPILLLADRQTTGGYPKIATVIAADLPLAGQLGPGDAIEFAVCTRKEAMAALIAHERALMRVERGA